MLVVGREGRYLVGLMLSSQSGRADDRNWIGIGAGKWDGEGRPSYVGWTGSSRSASTRSGARARSWRGPVRPGRRSSTAASQADLVLTDLDDPDSSRTLRRHPSPSPTCPRQYDPVPVVGAAGAGSTASTRGGRALASDDERGPVLTAASSPQGHPGPDHLARSAAPSRSGAYAMRGALAPVRCGHHRWTGAVRFFRPGTCSAATCRRALGSGATPLLCRLRQQLETSPRRLPQQAPPRRPRATACLRRAPRGLPHPAPHAAGSAGCARETARGRQRGREVSPIGGCVRRRRVSRRRRNRPGS